MGLQSVKPSRTAGVCEVTLTQTSFRFSAAARDVANLHDIHWVQVHIDSEDRLIVFEPKPGLERVANCFTLGTSKKGYKTLTAKKLIKEQKWIASVASLGISERKFELRRYEAGFKAWYIQLIPAFELSVKPSEIDKLTADDKGIYRYRGGRDGNEIVYIGKGTIKDRYRDSPERKEWRIVRIEYSLIEDDQRALEWESYWLRRFREVNNDRLPRFNLINGHESS